MTIYRIARQEFCDLSGTGAKKYGGRWNFPGYPAVYGSSSISSALLERLTVDPELFASERYVLYAAMEIHCPDSNISIFAPELLPEGWDNIPAGRISQEFGSRQLKKGLLCFGAPSVVDKTSINYVINPLAPDVKKLKVTTYPLRLDHRLIRY